MVLAVRPESAQGQPWHATGFRIVHTENGALHSISGPRALGAHKRLRAFSRAGQERACARPL